MKKFGEISLILGIFFLVLVPLASAHHRSRILGASTSNTTPSLPPTVEGPGFILPSSPLFFLDKFKQEVRIAFAFTPEKKAKVYSRIAGERLAELRFELEKKNEKGIQTALEEMNQNIKDAASEIARAQLSGKNVAQSAKEINNDLKQKQQSLDFLKSQASGELKARVNVVSQSLLESKVKLEDALPEEDLENEIKEDIERAIEDRVNDAENLTKDLEEAIDELQEQAKEAAKQSLEKREKTIKKAIEEKNLELKRQQERLAKEEQERKDQLIKLEKEEIEQAKETIRKAKEAAEKFRSAKQKTDEVKSDSSQKD